MEVTVTNVLILTAFLLLSEVIFIECFLFVYNFTKLFAKKKLDQ